MPYIDERLDTVFLLSERDKKMSFHTRSFTHILKVYLSGFPYICFGLLLDLWSVAE